MKHTYTVEESDKADHESGLELIRVLRLKKQRHNGRYDLTHGDKTPCGVFRTVRGICMSHAELNAAELLATLERLASLADEGVVMRHETGKPTWSFIDEVKKQARAAITKATK